MISLLHVATSHLFLFFYFLFFFIFIFYFFYSLPRWWNTFSVDLPLFVSIHCFFFYADQLVIIRLVSVWKGDKFCFYVVLKVYFI